jgi:formylglycine-generating enzyme
VWSDGEAGSVAEGFANAHGIASVGEIAVILCLVRKAHCVLVAAAATISVGLGSCSLATLDGLAGPAPDNAADASDEARLADVAAAAVDASVADRADGGNDASSAECPSRGGPTPVKVTLPKGGFYCIDRTEVTRAQYRAFLASDGVVNTHPRCSGNMGFVPSVTLDGDELPVMGIDWCDAHAFCHWAGKRLCGRIGGGPQTVAGATTNAEFVDACSRGGTRAYPYGPTYEAAACNGAQYGAGAPVAVGTAQACEGGYEGIFDLSGNVAEWVGACDETDSGGGQGDLCALLNSGYEEAFAPDLRCVRSRAFPRNSTGIVGVRCCGP